MGKVLGWGSPLAGLMLLLGAIAGPAPGNAVAEGSLVTAQGRHFVGPDGRPAFVWGVNYVGHGDRAWTMWEDGRFDATLVGEDFAKARAAGASVVRIFIRSPLERDIAAGRWQKLDAVLALAKQQGLRLLITFHDYREDNLLKVAAVIRAVAGRYAAESAVFGYDLRNEPHFSDLLAAQYPSGAPPLLGDALVKAYGERANQAEVNAWRLTDEGRAVIPSRFSDREAYYAANGYRIYQELVAAAGDWVKAREYNVSVLDYLAAPEAGRWRPLLNVLDATLAAWLQPQLAALRAADRGHLVTVGYSDFVLASLPANGTLNFLSLHRFPEAGVKALRVTVAMVQQLQRTFPEKPVLAEEFGYSNAGRSTAATALDESALLLSLWSGDLSGGLKWMLNDVAEGFNAREQSFGLYQTDDGAKPVVAAMRALAGYFAATDTRGGTLSFTEDGAALGYTYRAPDALVVGGRQYAATGLSFAAAEPIMVALTWTDRSVLAIAATGRTELTLNPRALLGDAGVRAEYQLTRADGQAVPFTVRGEAVSFTAEAGESYRLRLTRTALDARIEIVWPHGSLPVRQAELANVGAYLFERGTGRAFCAPGQTKMRLWRALNNGVEEPVAAGEVRAATAGGVAFEAWDFNNVDVSAARDPATKLYFRLSVDGWDFRSNVWSHAADARTYFPNVDTPTGIAQAPEAVDAKIEIVWPQGNLPVDRAQKVNVGAYLFQHGTTLAVPPGWVGTVRLWRSLNNGVAEEVAVGQKVLRTAGNLTFPAWEFNDVDVSAARDPVNKYYFRLSVDGTPSYSNVWSHGKDARTYFPKTDVPESGGGC